MAVEQARVVSVTGRRAVLETVEKSTCGDCRAKAVCGHGVIARKSAKQCLLDAQLNSSMVRLPKAGDWVSLSYPDKDLAQLAGLVYILPITLLVVAITVGDYLGLSASTLLLCAIATMLMAATLVRALVRKITVASMPTVDAIIDIRLVEK